MISNGSGDGDVVVVGGGGCGGCGSDSAWCDKRVNVLKLLVYVLNGELVIVVVAVVVVVDVVVFIVVIVVIFVLIAIIVAGIPNRVCFFFFTFHLSIWLCNHLSIHVYAFVHICRRFLFCLCCCSFPHK